MDAVIVKCPAAKSTIYGNFPPLGSGSRLAVCYISLGWSQQAAPSCRDL